MFELTGLEGIALGNKGSLNHAVIKETAGVTGFSVLIDSGSIDSAEGGVNQAKQAQGDYHQDNDGDGEGR